MPYTIATPHGPRVVPGIPIAEGLAVTKLPDDPHWAVTHVPSGYRVAHVYPDRDTAIQAAVALEPLADWTARRTTLAQTPGLDAAVATALRPFLVEAVEDPALADERAPCDAAPLDTHPERMYHRGTSDSLLDPRHV